MNFKLGDFVRFVDEKREGYITRMIDALTVGVTDTDGFEIPVAMSNLTTVHGHEANSASADSIREEVSIAPEAFKADGVFLTVTEAQKGSPAVLFHVLNQSSWQLLVSLTSQLKGRYKGEFAGIIPALGQSRVYSANLADIDIWPSFTIQLLFHTGADRKPGSPRVWEKKFRAKDFSAAKEKIEGLNLYGWRTRMDEPALHIDPQQLKESFFRGEDREETRMKQPPEEVDLHIENLRDDHHLLSAGEILAAQLSHVQHMLDAALVNRMPRIIFIHGVGNGTLRHELHRIVSRHPQVRTFMDAQKQKFGYGATEVVFKL